jgi:DNA-3-methyladenine glycosylase II
MSSRRSARLSVASRNIKKDVVNELKEANKAPSKKRKIITGEPLANGKTASPSTPKKKRATKSNIPLVTSTPEVIGLMTAPYSSGEIDDRTPPPSNRLAVPNGTNAPLISPETHRLVSNKAFDQVSPSKASSIKITTGNILDEALAHIVKVEPKLKPVIEKHPCHVFSPEGLAEEIDPFRSLVSGIIAQQVCQFDFNLQNYLEFK